MEIFNRDYTGETETEVINFVGRQIKQMGDCGSEEAIDWGMWNSSVYPLSVDEAKCKWRTIKKKIKHRTALNINEILKSARIANKRKKLIN
jgi:hypothetical protein